MIVFQSLRDFSLHFLFTTVYLNTSDFKIYFISSQSVQTYNMSYIYCSYSCISHIRLPLIMKFRKRSVSYLKYSPHFLTTPSIALNLLQTVCNVFWEKRIFKRKVINLLQSKEWATHPTQWLCKMIESIFMCNG